MVRMNPAEFTLGKKTNKFLMNIRHFSRMFDINRLLIFMKSLLIKSQ